MILFYFFTVRKQWVITHVFERLETFVGFWRI